MLNLNKGGIGRKTSGAREAADPEKRLQVPKEIPKKRLKMSEYTVLRPSNSKKCLKMAR